MAWYGKAHTYVKDVAGLVYPAVCDGCGVITEIEKQEGEVRLCEGCGEVWRRLISERQCEACGRLLPEAGACAECNGRGVRPLGRVVAVQPYVGPVRSMIRHVKFGYGKSQEGAVGGGGYVGGWDVSASGDWALCQRLGDVLGRRVREAYGATDGGGVDVVVWVPLHWQRRMSRGFDQAEVLARGVAKALGVPVVRGLVRVKPTPAQSLQMTRRDRVANLRGAFVPRGGGVMGRWFGWGAAGNAMRGKRVLLVDDILTTGSTLRAAARACLMGGAASVNAAVLATAVGTLQRPRAEIALGQNTPDGPMWVDDPTMDP